LQEIQEEEREIFKIKARAELKEEDKEMDKV